MHAEAAVTTKKNYMIFIYVFSQLCFPFFRQKCLGKALKKCLKRCSSDVEKCLERVIGKYDPDDEEVCFPFKQGYHSCL